MTNEEVKRNVDSLVLSSSFSQILAALAACAHEKAERVKETAPEETTLMQAWYELASKLLKAQRVTNILQ